MSTRMSHYQESYVRFVRRNPGCCIADVDRACRVNPLAGHRWVYDGVRRLISRGILVTGAGSGGRVTLRVSD